ncbi:unnamed protein product [Peniophora sp. CBMAI 1063]|nr:unnamed protein product [Peniophora sp. CBMAI 1063]
MSSNGPPAQAFIHRLPNEILVMIFFLYQSLQPAGYWYQSLMRVDLGWIRLMFVCERWREIIRNTPGLWTRIGTFYNRNLMAEFYQRARDAPLNIDLDTLSMGQSIYADLWPKNARWTCFTPLITQNISSTTFPNLTWIDVFLPTTCGSLSAIVAPALVGLALRSDAADQSQCPVNVSVLIDIFQTCHALKSVKLVRVINAGVQCKFPHTSGARRSLTSLEIASFDERLLDVITHFYVVPQDAKLVCELYGVTDLPLVVTTARRLYGDGLPLSPAELSLDRASDCLYDESGLRALYSSSYLAVKVNFSELRSLTLRLDAEHPTWQWHDLIASYPCASIHALALGDELYDGDDEVPEHWEPQTIVRALESVHSLTLKEEGQFDILSNLSDGLLLRSITIKLKSFDAASNLTRLWYFLRDNKTSPSHFTTTFLGRTTRHHSVSHLVAKEAPLIAAIAQLSTVVDERTMMKPHKTKNGKVLVFGPDTA